MSKRSSHHPLIQSPNYFLKTISHESPLNSFFYSVIFIVSLISLFAYFMLKEKIYLNYSMYLISSLAVFWGIQGYIFQYTTKWVPGYSISFFGLVNFFIILFAYDLFEIRSKFQCVITYLISSISLLFSLFSILYSLFSLFGLTTLAFEGLYTVVIATQFYIIISCLLNALRCDKNRVILIFISLSFLVSSIGLINDKVYVPYSDLIDAAYQPVALAEILLFGFVLLKRFYFINIEKQQALKLARIKTLEALKLEAEKEKMSINARIGLIASQVSHDIRSPLSALTLLTGSLNEIPEDKRILVRSAINRITDIANNLLEKSKLQSLSGYYNHAEMPNHRSQQLQVTLLSTLIDSIVSEKRIQFREKQEIEIEGDINQGYGLFSNIDATELKRTISNLVNNAVEAFPNEAGKVTVAVRNYSEQTTIIIQDNGKGIPESILKKLGERGFSHGKYGTQSGSGLGIYHAKKTVEETGGKFQIQSREGIGTTITLTFNKVIAPKWFVEKLMLAPNIVVTSLDDDISIHQIWKGRFESMNVSEFCIKHRTFTSGLDFKTWVTSQNCDVKSERLYLVDYELLNQSATGLDIIEELGIGAQAILVTSRYEEDKIRERCECLGVRLIPKAMAGFVPIEIAKAKEYFGGILLDDDSLVNLTKITQNTMQSVSDVKVRYDLCLLDDDRDLVQATWGFVAKSKGLNIKMFTTPSEFFAVAETIDRQTPIYLDVSLGNNIKGTDIANEIHKLGFSEINLATGYDADSIDVPPFVKRVVGKDFPLTIT